MIIINKTHRSEISKAPLDGIKKRKDLHALKIHIFFSNNHYKRTNTPNANALRFTEWLWRMAVELN